MKSFVTEAQRRTTSDGPALGNDAVRSDDGGRRGRDRPRVDVLQRLHGRQAILVTVMERQIISSGSPYEPSSGYSRAVRVGDRVFVAGTAPIMADGADPPADAYGQAKRCLEIIAAALEQAGGSLADVVRTRAYLTEADAFDGFAKAHGEAFADVRPANTTVVVRRCSIPAGCSRSRSRPSSLLQREQVAFLDTPARERALVDLERAAVGDAGS